MNPSDRTRVRRLPDRGRYDSATVHAILDEGFVCHVAFADERGPVVIPMAYARVGDTLYIHGAAANAALRAAAAGAPVCVTVTLVDGLVLARSAFHHSINYRSVVVFGAGQEITALEDKRAAVAAIVDHVIAGRSRDARPASDSELRATRVLAIPLHEASAKIRIGGPVDDDDDLGLPVWAGEIPLRLAALAPVAAPGLGRIPLPAYASSYHRGPSESREQRA